MIEYRAIDGFPGYKISNTGSVMSCILRGPGRRYGDKWYNLAVHINKRDSRFYVSLRKENHKRYRISLHILLLSTFVGPCPDGLECRHLNGNCQDNRIENLCWGTHRENMGDKAVHGTQCQGESIPFSKLKEEEVYQIRELYRNRKVNKMTLATIGRKYNINAANVCMIGKRKTWKHLPEK